MSLLSETLNRIFLWLQNNYPSGALSLRPGLDLSYIEIQTKQLPFQVTQEVYDLYRWANGHYPELLKPTEAIFFGMCLCRLERTRIYLDHLRALNEIDYMGKSLFPLFIPFQVIDKGSAFAIVCDVEKRAESPVIDISETGDMFVRYTSLTSMMLTLAEAYEADAFYIDKSIYPYEGHIAEKDSENTIRIHQKYNSRIFEMTLEKLHYDLLNKSSQKALIDFEGALYGIATQGVEISLSQVNDISLLEPLVDALSDDNEYARRIAKRVLEYLGYP